MSSDEKKEFDEVMFFLTRYKSKFSLEAAKSAIREFCNLTDPIRASEKALEKAKERGESLKNLSWKDQPKIDPDRQIYHYEHLWTVTDIINECKAVDTEHEVSEILKKLEVVWILKEENANLKTTRRSKNPEEIEYNQEAGILLKDIEE